jgi:hypothetical protein
MGAVASLEEHLEKDYEIIFSKARKKAKKMMGTWNKIPGVKTRLFDIGEDPEEPSRISLHLILDKNPDEVNNIVKILMRKEPSIWVSSESNHLIVNLTSFRGLMLARDEDTPVVIDSISQELK